MTQIRVLSVEDQRLLHEKTVEILEKTGVVVKSQRIQFLMEELRPGYHI